MNQSDKHQSISGYTWIYAYNDAIVINDINCGFSADVIGLNWDVEEVNRSSGKRCELNTKFIEVSVFNKNFDGTILLPQQSVQLDIDNQRR